MQEELFNDKRQIAIAAKTMETLKEDIIKLILQASEKTHLMS